MLHIDSTYEYLEGLLDDKERERRSLPPKKRVRTPRGGDGGSPAGGAAAGPGPRSARSSKSNADRPAEAASASVLTEDDEDTPLLLHKSRSAKKRRSRYTA